MLLKVNQKLLEIIQVSNKEIENIVNLFKAIDTPVKITGAGGGGFLIAFIPVGKDLIFGEIANLNVY